MDPVEEILQLGDPRLRELAHPVEDFSDPAVQADADRLCAALAAFRHRYGFGRAIAAPQLGIRHRMIALAVPDWPDVIINPELTWRSDETRSLWDDCMCFPFLLVRVRRAASVSVRFRNRNGGVHRRHGLDTSLAELLQHEMDHLDGILAVDRALDKNALISRRSFERNRDYFLRQVDYGGEIALPGA